MSEPEDTDNPWKDDGLLPLGPPPAKNPGETVDPRLDRLKKISREVHAGWLQPMVEGHKLDRPWKDGETLTLSRNPEDGPAHMRWGVNTARFDATAAHDYKAAPDVDSEVVAALALADKLVRQVTELARAGNAFAARALATHCVRSVGGMNSIAKASEAVREAITLRSSQCAVFPVLIGRNSNLHNEAHMTESLAFWRIGENAGIKLTGYDLRGGDMEARAHWIEMMAADVLNPDFFQGQLAGHNVAFPWPDLVGHDKPVGLPATKAESDALFEKAWQSIIWLVESLPEFQAAAARGERKHQSADTESVPINTATKGKQKPKGESATVPPSTPAQQGVREWLKEGWDQRFWPKKTPRPRMAGKPENG